MRLFRPARLLLLALLVFLVPAMSHAGVFISVGFAPPMLPIYAQPICPEPGLMWTPGYWAYGPDGYYWVPGAWVPAPYVGALWTPGYWGFGGGFYTWYPGYWGPYVGYYGGINYGFGYFGIGFVGGMWHGGVFDYNTAVMRVNTRFIHNVYSNRAVIGRYTVARDSHVAFNGGRGGIRYSPNANERAAMNERHMGATSFQTQHADQAMHNHNAYARYNGGHPRTLAESRPLGRATEARPMNQARGSMQSRGAQQYRSAPQQRSQQRSAPQQRYQQRAAPQQRYQQRSAPQPRYQQRAAPQHSAPRGGGHPQSRPQDNGHRH